MFLIDESESRVLSSRRGATVDDAVDSGVDYENALIWLLSQLEYKRQGLVRHRSDGQILPMLELATEFVDLVVAFAEEHCMFAVGREIDEGKARVRDFRTAATAWRDRLQDPTAKSGVDVNAAILPTAKRGFAALQDGVAAYFTVFTGRFATSRAALPWVEAAASFVVELKKLTREPLLNQLH